MIYLPPHFSVVDRAAVRDLVRAHPLATLISATPDEPLVTHAPLLLDESAEPWTLLGHVARANPHWQAWEDGRSVTAIFHGGDAYISPSLYGTLKAVPTWNYAVVHLRGPVTLLHDSEAKERVLKVLIDRHDPPYHPQWNQLDAAYREGMKSGIVAFELAVERVEAKFKLSQNRPAADRERVRAAMHAGGGRSLELAGWMDRLVPRAVDG
jgi:transcriptional regulator